MEKIYFNYIDGKVKVIINDTLTTLETNNPELLIELGNKFFSGDIIDDECIDNLKVLKQIMSELDIEINIDNTKDIVFLNGYSVNELLSLFSAKKNDKLFILNLENDILILPANLKNVCEKCALLRYIYSKDKFYSDKNNWNNKSTCNNKNIIEYCYFLARKQIRMNSKEAIIVNKITLDAIYSKVIPIENCDICFPNNELKTENINLSADTVVYTENGLRTHSSIETLNNFDKYFNPLGPITEMIDDSRIDRLGFPVFQSSIATNPLLKNFNYHGGKGVSYLQSRCSAYGEAFERYNAQMLGTEKLISSTYNEMISSGKKVLNPRDLILDNKYINHYDENVKIDWVLGKELLTNTEVYLPANSVFFIYDSSKDSVQFLPQDTTGLSSGLTVGEAIYQGLLEVIERDSYTIYYRKQICAKTIDSSTIDSVDIKYILDKLYLNNLKVNLKYLENDFGVHVVHCTLEDVKGNLPIYTHGCGAALDIKTAVIRSITEAIQLRVSQIKIFDNIDDFINNEEYEPYIEWGKGNKDYLDMFLDHINDEKIDFKEFINYSKEKILDNIQFLLKKLSKNGYNVYVANLSRMENNVKTVRVIVPGLQPADDTCNRNTNRLEMFDKLYNSGNNKNIFFDKRLFS